jgi:hypothetical protein
MASFRLEPGYLSGALPKLDMMAVNQLLCLHHGHVVIRANRAEPILETHHLSR